MNSFLLCGFLLKQNKNWAEWETKLRFSLHDLVPSSTTSISSIPSTTNFIKWSSPPHDSIKINFDRSKSNHRAAAGFVVRDCRPKLLTTSASNLVKVILVAEVIAMRNGVISALQESFVNLVIEGDNKFSYKWCGEKFMYHGKSMLLL